MGTGWLGRGKRAGVVVTTWSSEFKMPLFEQSRGATHEIDGGERREGGESGEVGGRLV